MRITKEIHGCKYEIEIPFNQEVAKSMEQNYYGYKIVSKTAAYSTKLYKVNTSAFLPNETKLIGTLVYDIDGDILTLYKFVDMNIHKHIKSDSFGVNNEVISRLRPRDCILISDGERNYKMSVRKALTVGKYMQFDRYEKQLFIPISEFQVKELPKRTKGNIKKSK